VEKRHQRRRAEGQRWHKSCVHCFLLRAISFWNGFPAAVVEAKNLTSLLLISLCNGLYFHQLPDVAGQRVHSLQDLFQSEAAATWVLPAEVHVHSFSLTISV